MNRTDTNDENLEVIGILHHKVNGIVYVLELLPNDNEYFARVVDNPCERTDVYAVLRENVIKYSPNK